MAVFPINKEPEGSKYTIKRTPRIARTSMDSGYVRQRTRSKSLYDSIGLTYYLTNDELNTFEDWYEQDINNGSGWFDIPLKDGNGMRVFVARLQSGNYEFTKLGDKWKLTFTVDIQDRNG